MTVLDPQTQQFLQPRLEPPAGRTTGRWIAAWGRPKPLSLEDFKRRTGFPERLRREAIVSHNQGRAVRPNSTELEAEQSRANWVLRSKHWLGKQMRRLERRVPAPAKQSLFDQSVLVHTRLLAAERHDFILRYSAAERSAQEAERDLSEMEVVLGRRAPAASRPTI